LVLNLIDSNWKMTKPKALSKVPALRVDAGLIGRRIHLIRSHRVMLDSDLAELYQVETKALNRAVQRNPTRFPEDFMFRLTPKEVAGLRCQSGTSSFHGGRRYAPYVFTQEGVAMLSSVLHSSRAVQVNVAIMRAFVRLREVMATHKELSDKIAELERKFSKHDKEIQVVFNTLKRLIEPPPASPRRRIGYVA
jgi:hypothetical protein